MDRLPETLDPTTLQRIQALAEHFDKAWQAGRRPRLEDYLKNAVGPVRASILRTLLARELTLLGRQGVIADAQVYLARFPTDAAVVVEAFAAAARETTTAEASRLATNAVRPPSPYPLPPEGGEGQKRAAAQATQARKPGRF